MHICRKIMVQRLQTEVMVAETIADMGRDGPVLRVGLLQHAFGRPAVALVYAAHS